MDDITRREPVKITVEGCKLISLFPAEDLRRTGRSSAQFRIRAGSELRLALNAPKIGASRVTMTNAITAPEIGRVKKIVQSLPKLIMVFMKASSASGPRMAPRTKGARGNRRRSAP